MSLPQTLEPNERGVRLRDGKGNFLGYEDIRVISDEELQVEQTESETKEANDNALNAYLNFGSLTLAQKNKILKGLLGDFISRHRDNYILS